MPLSSPQRHDNGVVKGEGGGKKYFSNKRRNEMEEGIKKIELYGETGYAVFDKNGRGIFGCIQRWEDKKTGEWYVKIRLQECFVHESGIRLQWKRLGPKETEWKKTVPGIALAVPELAQGAREIITQLLKDAVGNDETPKEAVEVEAESDKIDELLEKVGRI